MSLWLGSVLLKGVPAVRLGIKAVDIALKSKNIAGKMSGAYEAHWVTLNVGGQKFLTTRRTLLADPNSLFVDVVREIGEVLESQKHPTLRDKYMKFMYGEKWKISGEDEDDRLLLIEELKAVNRRRRVRNAELMERLKNKQEKEETEEDVILRVQKGQFDKDKQREHENMVALKLTKVKNMGKGMYNVDRDPEYFSTVLNFLRTGRVTIPANISKGGVLLEAEFWEVEPMIKELKGEKSEHVFDPFANVVDDLKVMDEQVVKNLHGRS